MALEICPGTSLVPCPWVLIQVCWFLGGRWAMGWKLGRRHTGGGPEAVPARRGLVCGLRCCSIFQWLEHPFESSGMIVQCLGVGDVADDIGAWFHGPTCSKLICWEGGGDGLA